MALCSSPATSTLPDRRTSAFLVGAAVVLTARRRAWRSSRSPVLGSTRSRPTPRSPLGFSPTFEPWTSVGSLSAVLIPRRASPLPPSICSRRGSGRSFLSTCVRVPAGLSITIVGFGYLSARSVSRAFAALQGRVADGRVSVLLRCPPVVSPASCASSCSACGPLCGLPARAVFLRMWRARARHGACAAGYRFASANLLRCRARGSRSVRAVGRGSSRARDRSCSGGCCGT